MTATFVSRLRQGGNAKVITVPKEYVEYHDLKDGRLYQIIIQEKSESESKMSNLWSFHENYGVTV